MIDFELSSKGICKCTDFKSIFQMNFADRKVSKIPFVNGIGYTFFLLSHLLF